VRRRARRLASPHEASSHVGLHLVPGSLVRSGHSRVGWHLVRGPLDRHRNVRLAARNPSTDRLAAESGRCSEARARDLRTLLLYARIHRQAPPRRMGRAARGHPTMQARNGPAHARDGPRPVAFGRAVRDGGAGKVKDGSPQTGSAPWAGEGLQRSVARAAAMAASRSTRSLGLLGGFSRQIACASSRKGNPSRPAGR